MLNSYLSTLKNKESFFTPSLLSGRTLGAILLVAGTTIGAGMLGLPAVTAQAGIYCSSALLVLCWAISLLAAFMILELTLCYREEVNFITMIKDNLGLTATIIAWIFYSLFLYALLIAYLLNGSGLLARLLNLPLLSSVIGLTCLFGTTLYLGAKYVDQVNRFFMIVLLALFAYLVMKITPYIVGKNLAFGNADHLFIILPILWTSFAFHGIIPSLKSYLKNNIHQLKFVLIVGSFLPLMTYIIWETVIIGTIQTEGQYGLATLEHETQLVAGMMARLERVISGGSLLIICKGFALLAILSSLAGTALALFDFLADGLRIQKTHLGRFNIAILTLLPAMLFAIFFEKGFVALLRYSGIFATLLYVFFPTWMLWQHRYAKKSESLYKMPGGKAAIIGVFIFGLALMILQLIAL